MKAGTARGLGFGLVALVFLLDQASKAFILEGLAMAPGDSIALLPVFSLTFVWNQGISLGLLPQNSEIGRIVLTGLTMLIAVLLGWWLARTREPLPVAALGLILGGALGNILDRVRFGAVADFIHLHVGTWSFYIFNVADGAITVGVVLLLLDGLRGGKAGAGT